MAVLSPISPDGLGKLFPDDRPGYKEGRWCISPKLKERLFDAVTFWWCDSVMVWMCDRLKVWWCGSSTAWWFDDVILWWCDVVVVWWCDNVVVCMMIWWCDAVVVWCCGGGSHCHCQHHNHTTKKIFSKQQQKDFNLETSTIFHCWIFKK